MGPQNALAVLRRGPGPPIAPAVVGSQATATVEGRQPAAPHHHHIASPAAFQPVKNVQPVKNAAR